MKKIRRLFSMFLVLIMLFSSVLSTVSAQAISSEEVIAARVQEIESLRQTNSETYLLSDGSYECVVFAQDKYFLDESDQLQVINNSIILDKTSPFSTNRQYKNTANAFDVFFSDGDTPEVNIQYNEKSIAFSPTGTPDLSGKHINANDHAVAIGKVNNCSALEELTPTGSNTIMYNNVFADTDFVYVLENNALKEYIILNSADAPNEFSFTFELNGVSIHSVDGNIVFTAEDGATMFSLGSLFAVDANGVYTEALTYKYTPTKDANIVSVSIALDENYLLSADRVFPVIIDPTIMVSSAETADACVCEDFPTTNYQMAYQLRTGADVDYGIRRTYIKFNIPSSIPVNSVTSAVLQLEKVSGVAPTTFAYRCTGSWSSGTITWNNKPGYTTSNQSTISISAGSGSSWYKMTVTGIVQAWVNGTASNYGFVVKDVIESDENHWTTFYSSDAASPHKPELHITYSSSSVTPSISLNPTSVTLEVDATRTLYASVTPSGSSVSWSSNDTSVATVSSSGVVTAKYPGKATITASISGASASCVVTVTPKGGYLYDLSVANYYDTGYSIRASSALTSLIAYNNAVSARFAGIFNLRMTPTYHTYSSATDNCKISRFGSVQSSNLDDLGCTHLSKCNTTAALRSKLISDGNGGSSINASVLWTGHRMQDAETDRSNASDLSNTIIITPQYTGNATESTFTLMHEISHLLGVRDHYCAGIGPGGKCSNKYCDTCWQGREETRFCLMSARITIANYSDAVLYCSDCLAEIRTHLSDHH